MHVISRRRFFVTGGGAALGAMAALNKATASLIASKDRPYWRFCQKCFVMFYSGDKENGSCAAGGAHVAQGYPFFLPFDVRGTPTAQTNWRYCLKCHAMFFDGYQEKGRCAAGGGHAAQGYNFVLPHDNR